MSGTRRRCRPPPSMPSDQASMASIGAPEPTSRSGPGAERREHVRDGCVPAAPGWSRRRRRRPARRRAMFRIDRGDDRVARPRAISGRRKGRQGRDADHRDPAGQADRPGGRDADPNAGERAGTDRHGDPAECARTRPRAGRSRGRAAAGSASAWPRSIGMHLGRRGSASPRERRRTTAPRAVSMARTSA